MTEALILFGLFALFLLMSIPIGYAIGMSTLITLVFVSDIPYALITQNAVAGIDSFPLMAIPFFILAGNLMSTGGVAKRIVNFASMLLGTVTGGLGMVTTVACMFFAAISGSAMATTSAIGSFMVPEMEKHGYEKGFSASLAAAAGTIGVVIPPSIPFVIYGVATNTSISELFVAGLIPGILMGVALMLVCYIVSKKRGYVGTSSKPSLMELWTSFKDAIWALLTPIIILGGIYGGFFTPTEAAVVAVVYSVFASTVIYKEFTIKDLYKSLIESMSVNGITTFMMGFSMAFASYLTMQGIPQTISTILISITDNKIILLIIINIFLLCIGCLIDNGPATIILAPILLPVVTSLGMSPVTFGVMLTLNLAIGFITPPYGINLFVATAISGVSMSHMMKSMVWFILALLSILLLVTYFEPTTMFFVDMMFG